MGVWTHTPLAGGPSHKSLLSLCRVNWGHDNSENPNSDIVYLTTAGNLTEMPKMMVWNRGKSFKISKWLGIRVKFQRSNSKFYSNLWMDDVFFFFVGLGQKHHVHQKKTQPHTSASLARQGVQRFCEANGEAPPLLWIWGFPKMVVPNNYWFSY